MDKEIIFYDSTDYSERYYNARAWIFECDGAEKGWESEDDVPEKLIFDEMDWQDQSDWRYCEDVLKRLLDNNHCLITGYCGRWDGRADGGKFIETYRELMSCISHLDYLKVYDLNGHLFIEGYHHDGSDKYEIKVLTRKGYELADSNYFDNSRELHGKIMSCNLFSRLPKLAQKEGYSA